MRSRSHGQRDEAVHNALRALAPAYAGDSYRLLADVADLLGADVASVDRPTVEAHLERTLSDREWAAATGDLSAMAFDEYVGEAGSFRTDLIEDLLATAGVPGRSHAADTPPAAALPPRGS